MHIEKCKESENWSKKGRSIPGHSPKKQTNHATWCGIQETDPRQDTNFKKWPKELLHDECMHSRNFWAWNIWHGGHVVKNERWDMAKDSSGNSEEGTRLFMSKGRLIQPKKPPFHRVLISSNKCSLGSNCNLHDKRNIQGPWSQPKIRHTSKERNQHWRTRQKKSES